jgi:hypothetical protein
VTLPTEYSRAAWKTPRRRLAVAGALLLASALSAPPASATLAGEAAGTAGSVVESATGAPAPSVPTTPPPAPPAPATPPAPPVQVPVDPVKAPTEAAPPPSSGAPKGATTGADAVSTVEEVARGAGGSATAAMRASTEATSSAPAHGGGSPFGDARPASGSGKHSPKLTRATPVGRFLAYVWPAMALEQYKDLLSNFIARLEAVRPLPLPDAATGSSPSGSSGRTHAAHPSPGQQIGMPASTAGHPSLGATLAEGAKTLLYAAAAALLALFIFAAWAELRSAIRSRSITDKWHQGF